MAALVSAGADGLETTGVTALVTGAATEATVFVTEATGVVIETGLVAAGADVPGTTDVTALATGAGTLAVVPSEVGASEEPAAPARPDPKRRTRRTPRTVKPASITKRLSTR